MTERLKNDHGKPRFDLIDPQFELDLATVLAHGASKYKAGSWKQVEIDAYFGAIRRHINAINRGEYLDPDSGLPHTAHISANAMFISYLARVEAVNPLNQECDDYDPNLRRNAATLNNINPVACIGSKDSVRHNPETSAEGCNFKDANESVTSEVPTGRGTHQRL